MDLHKGKGASFESKRAHKEDVADKVEELEIAPIETQTGQHHSRRSLLLHERTAKRVLHFTMQIGHSEFRSRSS